MQQKWDDIDSLIINQMEELVPSENYNEILMNKLRCDNVKKSKDHIVAMSFIMTGILAMVLYTSDIQYKLIDWKIKAKSEVMSIQGRSTILDIYKIIRGE
jgi:hypothetical protein